MKEWSRNVQKLTARIDQCIRSGADEEMTLRSLSKELGYSAFYVSRRFRETTGMSLRDYLRYRRLALVLREVREGRQGFLELALAAGFSSQAAFTRAFQAAYGVTPGEYRRAPGPVVLHTVLRPVDCYLTETMENGADSTVRAYLVEIPAHKFLHIRNDESIGYWDFWEKQSHIPGQDQETVCRLLQAVPGRLDDAGGERADASSGQLMAFINEPAGRLCSWGIPLSEAYGVRLPMEYRGEIPPQLQLMEVPEGEYLVFEHGPFDAAESAVVEARVENAMKRFDYGASGYELDLSQGRVFYFYHDCERFWKYVRPVRRRADSPK